MSVFGKALLTAAFLTLATPASAAGGWTNEAVPTKVEIVQDKGILIFGAFGNPGTSTCTTGDAVWVAKSHTEYTEVLSSALSAVAAQLKLKFYVHYCATVGWHGTDYNQFTGAGAMYVSR